MCAPGTAASADQRQPARQTPNVAVSRDALAALGVLSWEGLDADNHATDPALAALRKERNYNYSDIITISREKLPNYEAKIKTFFEEHLHTDEEIRCESATMARARALPEAAAAAAAAAASAAGSCTRARHDACCSAPTEVSGAVPRCARGHALSARLPPFFSPPRRRDRRQRLL